MHTCRYDAIYSILWVKSDRDNEFRAIGEYTTAARKLALSRVRGDDRTFSVESSKLSLPASGWGPLARAGKTSQNPAI